MDEWMDGVMDEWIDVLHMEGGGSDIEGYELL